MSTFDEDLLQRAETVNKNSFVEKIVYEVKIIMYCVRVCSVCIFIYH